MLNLWRNEYIKITESLTCWTVYTSASLFRSVFPQKATLSDCRTIFHHNRAHVWGAGSLNIAGAHHHGARPSWFPSVWQHCLPVPNLPQWRDIASHYYKVMSQLGKNTHLKSRRDSPLLRRIWQQPWQHIRVAVSSECANNTMSHDALECTTHKATVK